MERRGSQRTGMVEVPPSESSMLKGRIGWTNWPQSSEWNPGI